MLSSENKMISRQSHGGVAMLIPWRRISHHFVCFIHFQVTCSFLAMTLTLMSTHGASHESTDGPFVNLSDMIANFTDLGPQAPPTNITNHSETKPPVKTKSVVQRTVAAENDVPRDSPMALVIAASIAAVSILLFFVIAYLWHTHQLDSRARKLAIRMAADAEHGLRCRNCSPQPPSRYSRGIPRMAPRAVSESSQDQNHYEALTPSDERGPGSDGGRSSVGVSENEDAEDVFDSIQLPPIFDRGRPGSRGGRGAHRKWSRPRKTSSGASLDKRDSAVTDKEILTHFASRRHSTFFI